MIFCTVEVPGEVAAVWQVSVEDGKFMSCQVTSFKKTEILQISPNKSLTFEHGIELQSVPLTLDGEFTCTVHYLENSKEFIYKQNFPVSVTGMHINLSSLKKKPSF